MNLVRGLLLVEAAAFAAAALSHSGILIADPVAATAEAILAAVLLIGWLVTAWRPTWTRRTAVAVQAFALAGDLLGLTITVLADPERVADIVFHGGIAIMLGVGIVLAIRLRR